MKNTIFILIVILLISCGSTYKLEKTGAPIQENKLEGTRIVVYESEWVGDMVPPSHFIIKGTKQCDLTNVSLGYVDVGNYIIKNDTLFFNMKYSYYLSLDTIYPVHDSIPLVFLIKDRGDSLIHIVDDNPEHNMPYKRVYGRIANLSD